MTASTLSFEQWTLSQWEWVFLRHPYLRRALQGESLSDIRGIVFYEVGNGSELRLRIQRDNNNLKYLQCPPFRPNQINVDLLYNDPSEWRFVLHETNIERKQQLPQLSWFFSRDNGPVRIRVESYMGGSFDVAGVLCKGVTRYRVRRARDTCQLLGSVRVPEVLSLVCARFLMQ